jgi:hypothetical protein
MAGKDFKDRQINIRVNDEVYVAFEKGAADCGMSMAAWLTQLGLTALGKSPLNDQLSRLTAKAPRRKR